MFTALWVIGLNMMYSFLGEFQLCCVQRIEHINQMLPDLQLLIFVSFSLKCKRTFKFTFL